MNTFLKNFVLTILTILLTTLTTIILIYIFGAVSDVALHNYFNYCAFGNIWAEEATAVNPPLNDEVAGGVEATEEGIVKEDETSNASEKSESSNNNENETNAKDKKNESTTGPDINKKEARQQKVEKIISDLPEKTAAPSIYWRRFPIEFTAFNPDDFGVLKRQEGESITAYRLRYHRFLSALCTANAAKTLKGSDWNLIIEDTNLCSVSQTMKYELHYLELAEKDALEKGEYNKFLQTTDSQVLNIKRGVSKPQGDSAELDEQNKIKKAYDNYCWVEQLSKFECFNKPEYAFLKAMWENTVIDKTKSETDPTRLSSNQVEFYLHIELPKELLDDVIKENNGDPKFLKTSESIRFWLSMVEKSKRDPHFWDDIKPKKKK